MHSVFIPGFTTCKLMDSPHHRVLPTPLNTYLVAPKAQAQADVGTISCTPRTPVRGGFPVSGRRSGTHTGGTLRRTQEKRERERENEISTALA